MEPLLNIAVSAARQAGDIIIRYFNQLDRIKINTKAGEERFSEVDVKAEQTIINAIHKAYPSHGIVAEESGLHNENDEIVWIIDPLDGTHNYLHGFPFFAVSIGIKIKNRLEHGVVYDPLRHELFTSTRGRGARLNDHRIRVSKQQLLNSSLIGTGIPTLNLETCKNYLPTLEALIGKCSGVRRAGAAALDLAYTACGRLDGFWEFGLKPWDMAAGALLIQEAGGFISDSNGGDNYLKGGDIIAGNPKIYKALLETFQGAAAVKSNR